MTGLGRASAGYFASHAEKIQPDYLCIAKGLTGGYLPMAATLTTQEVFDSFLGEYDEFKTFFHGHSFTGNPLGAAASLASLDLLESGNTKQKTNIPCSESEIIFQAAMEIRCGWRHSTVRWSPCRRIG